MERQHTKSRELKVGDKIYFLEIVAPPTYKIYPNGRKRKQVLCKCVCGNTKTFLYENLTCKNELDRAKSCGCMNHIRNYKNAQKRRNSDSVYRYLYEQNKQGAKTRKLDFELTKEQHLSLIKKSCNYCGQPPPRKQPNRGHNYYVGVPVCYNGIDRVDSKIGYVIENCVPCCTLCNRMKQCLSVTEFSEHVLKIANHLNQSPQSPTKIYDS